MAVIFYKRVRAGKMKLEAVPEMWRSLRGGIYLWPRKFTWKNYTTVLHKDNLITGAYITVARTKYDLAKDSVVLLEQLRTIDKKRLKDKVCHLDHQILLKIDKALEISLELYT